MNEIFSAWHKKGYIEYGAKDTLIGTKEYNTSDNYNIRVCTSEEKRDEAIIQEIKKLQEEHPKERIAAIVRTNFQVLEFKKLCETNDITIETSVGGSLYKIEPTLDLLKLLHALKHHSRAKEVYGLYTTAYIAESVDKIEIDKLPEDDKIEYFRKNLPKSLKKWDSYIKRLRLEPVLKVVRDLIDDAKPWTIYANKIGGTEEKKRESKEYYLRNLDQVFENISLSSNSNYLTMNSLIDYLEIMILTKQEDDERESFIPENDNKVLICTTVHKAKGLEYEHVLLPYCMYEVADTRTKGDVDLIYSESKVGYFVKCDGNNKAFVNNHYKNFRKTEFEDRRKEEIRILYVAMTRAMKSLTCFVDNKENVDSRPKNWKDMIEVRGE